MRTDGRTDGNGESNNTDRVHEMKIDYWFIFQYCRTEIKTEDEIYQTERGNISLFVTRELCWFTKWKLIKLSGQQFYLTAAKWLSQRMGQSEPFVTDTGHCPSTPPKANVHNTLIDNPHVSNPYLRPTALCWSWTVRSAVRLPTDTTRLYRQTQHASTATHFSQKEKRNSHLYVY